MSINKIGHIGYLFIIFGMLLLAEQNTYGWVMRAIGEAIWLVVGIRMQMSSMWFWAVIFILLDIYGFYQWM